MGLKQQTKIVKLLLVLSALPFPMLPYEMENHAVANGASGKHNLNRISSVLSHSFFQQSGFVIHWALKKSEIFSLLPLAFGVRFVIEFMD